MSFGWFVAVVACSVGGVLLVETGLAYLGLGGSARYEHMVSVLSGRTELLIEEVRRLQGQIETTRGDTYPRVEELSQRIARVEAMMAPAAPGTRLE